MLTKINIHGDQGHSFRINWSLILFKTKLIDMKWYTLLIAIALLFVQCGGDDTPPWDDPDRGADPVTGHLRTGG